METYNFDEIVNRRGTNSYKWDVSDKENFLPMWVADMDFRTLPYIIERLQQRVAHGIFGYTAVPDSYYDAVTNWFVHRHNWLMQKEWIIYTSGVVPAISAIIKAMTQTGDKVLVQTPVYNCFFSSIKNNGCEVLCNELIYEDGTYRIDFDDLEQKAADPKTTVMILCNPHNPAGRVWTLDELQRMADICQRHHVRIISDEIHCELVMPGHEFVPFGRIFSQTPTPNPSRREGCLDTLTTDDATSNANQAPLPSGGAGGGCIICCSPSKSFNTAGLQMANIICADPETRRRIDRAININEICDVNPFAPLAVEAAYNEGEDWIDELNQYLWGNYQALLAFFAEHLPQLKVFKLEGTYLVWVDITATGLTADQLEEKLLSEANVWVNSGTMYGAEGYIRINIATQRARLMEGLRRMARVI